MSDDFIFSSYIEDVSICDDLIKLYKKSKGKKPGQIGRGIDKEIKDSTDLMIPTSLATQDPVISQYMKYLQNICNMYIDKYPMCNEYAAWSIEEALGIQHYKPTQGYHAWHTERVGYNSIDNKRHLVFMTYLNDVNVQGETEFYHQGVKFVSRKGLTLIWPADWTHTHRGIASPTEDKYIITGWYSYRTE